MAALYKATKELDKALENYDMALRISPNDDDLYYESAKILEEQNKNELAKQRYQ